MDPDLRAEGAGGFATPSYSGESELALVGEGFEYKRKFGLNGEGDTRYRAHLDEGPIDEIAADFVVAGRKLISFCLHTWDENGHRVNLFEAKDLADGEAKDLDINVELSGKPLALKARLSFAIIERP